MLKLLTTRPRQNTELKGAVGSQVANKQGQTNPTATASIVHVRLRLTVDVCFHPCAHHTAASGKLEAGAGEYGSQKLGFHNLVKNRNRDASQG